LPNLVGDKNLKNTLLGLLALAEQKTTFCREWRNRRFAHRDLALATGDNKATPLEAVDKEKVNAGLKALSEVLNEVERHYFKGGTSYDAIAARNGAATLLFVLGDGVKQKQLREKLIASGKFDDLDLPESI
jgi:AbiU2